MKLIRLSRLAISPHAHTNHDPANDSIHSRLTIRRHPNRTHHLRSAISYYRPIMAVSPHVHTTIRAYELLRIIRQSAPGRRRHPTTGYAPIYNRSAAGLCERATIRIPTSDCPYTLFGRSARDPAAYPYEQTNNDPVNYGSSGTSIPCGNTVRDPACPTIRSIRSAAMQYL